MKELHYANRSQKNLVILLNKKMEEIKELKKVKPDYYTSFVVEANTELKKTIDNQSKRCLSYVKTIRLKEDEAIASTADHLAEIIKLKHQVKINKMDKVDFALLSIFTILLNLLIWFLFTTFI